MAGRVNQPFPIRIRLRHEQNIRIFSVRTDFSDRQFLKFEYIFNQFVLFGVYRALFTARFRHHHDFFARDFFLFLVGIDAAEAQNAVCGNGKQPDDGCKEHRNESQNPRQSERHFLRFFHGDPFGDKLAENDIEICQYQRDENNADGIDDALGNAYSRIHQNFHQRLGEIVGGKGAAQKACQCDRHLYGG